MHNGFSLRKRRVLPHIEGGKREIGSHTDLSCRQVTALS